MSEAGLFGPNCMVCPTRGRNPHSFSAFKILINNQANKSFSKSVSERLTFNYKGLGILFLAKYSFWYNPPPMKGILRSWDSVDSLLLKPLGPSQT